MNFTSFHFLAFFAVTITLGHLLKKRPQRVFLLLASYYFYGVFSPWYLFLIIGSTLIDFIAGLAIEARRMEEEGNPLRPGFRTRLATLPRKTWLMISLTMNIGLLCYFKYTNFFIEVFNDTQPLGDSLFAWPMANILLPVGISFYTFQSMSYTIDVYRGVLTPRKNIVDFALYVAFFPQLVAGPIVRATTFLKQMDTGARVTSEDIIVGLTRITVGFFRKLVLSDNLAILVDSVFANPQNFGPVDMWLAGIGFGFQIYFDFAGYTDIARGLARLFGYEFELNFLYPMAAANIRQHWQRWHLSLTTWMQDYVYHPLGGSRVGPFRLYANIFVVWFIVGLWHGAAYHFLAWGIWQAVMLAVHRVYGDSRIRETLANGGGRIGFFFYDKFARLTTVFFLTFGFIWFRAPEMSKATLMQGRLFGFSDIGAAASGFFAWIFAGGPWTAVTAGLFGPAAAPHIPIASFQIKAAFPEYGVLLAFYFAYEYFFARFQLEYFWKEENKYKLVALLSLMLFAIATLSSPNTPPFAYFQF